jgi:hypothetical protein
LSLGQRSRIIGQNNPLRPLPLFSILHIAVRWH